MDIKWPVAGPQLYSSLSNVCCAWQHKNTIEIPHLLCTYIYTYLQIHIFFFPSLNVHEFISTSQIGEWKEFRPKTNNDAQAALEQLVDRYGSTSQSESWEMLKQRTKSQTISSSLMPPFSSLPVPKKRNEKKRKENQPKENHISSFSFSSELLF